MHAMPARTTPPPAAAAAMAATPPAEAVRAVARRCLRVDVLLLGVVLMNLGDLALTVLYMSTMGMAEENPLVVALVRLTGSWHALAAYKLLSTGGCVGLLYLVRRHRAGEIGAWVAVAVMVALTIRWHAYNGLCDDPEILAVAMSGTAHDGWVTIRR